MSFELKSPSFGPSGQIPSKYTADGANLSPSLEWQGTPEGTKSLALIVDDADAPAGTRVHWVVYNLPCHTSELHEGILHQEIIDHGALQGINDFKELGYEGPSPPPGELHRYFFKLYALDSTVNLSPGAVKEDLIKALLGHILDSAELIGRYGRTVTSRWSE